MVSECCSDATHSKTDFMSAPRDIIPAFGDFFLREREALLAFAASQPPSDYSPEDLLQEALEKAIRRLLRSEEYHDYRWFPWLRRLIRWTALDKRRRQKNAPVVLASDFSEEGGEDLIANTAANTQSPAALTIHAEQTSQIAMALKAIANEQERRCLELLYFDSANHPTLIEVAQTIGIKPTSIGKLHQRAKESLREKLRFIAPDLKTLTDTTNYES
jgi:RNA polymerase sigma factor (sigma-70 family)